MLAPYGGRLGPGRFSRTESAAQAWVSLCTVRFSAAGFVTALSDRFRSGGRFPASSFMASILPGLLVLDWPVKCPLYARAIDIFLAAPKGAAIALCHFACSNFQFKPHDPLAGSPILVHPANLQTGAYEHSLPSPAPGT